MPKESGRASLDEVAQWACMKSIELKECCKERKLPVTGTMSQLIARLYTGRKQPKDIEDDLMKELGHKNEYLVKRFTEAAQQEEGFRQLAFQSIAKMMTFYPYEIKDSKQLKGIRGIGKGTCKRINDYLAEQADDALAQEPREDEECKVWPAPMGHDPEYNPESVAMQVLHAVVVFFPHLVSAYLFRIKMNPKLESPSLNCIRCSPINRCKPYWTPLLTKARFIRPSMSTILNEREITSEKDDSEEEKPERKRQKTNKVATLLLRPTSYTKGCTITLQYYCADMKCKRRQELWEQSGYHVFSKAMDRHTGQFPELIVDGTSFVLFSNGIYWLECTYTPNSFFWVFILMAMCFVSLWMVPFCIMVCVYQMHVYLIAVNDCIVEKFTEMGLVKEENGVVYMLG